MSLISTLPVDIRKLIAYHIADNEIFKCSELNLPMDFFKYSFTYTINELDKGEENVSELYYCYDENNAFAMIYYILLYRDMKLISDFDFGFCCHCCNKSKCELHQIPNLCPISRNFNKQYDYEFYEFDEEKIKKIPFNVFLRLLSTKYDSMIDKKQICLPSHSITISVFGFELPEMAKMEEVIKYDHNWKDQLKK